MKTMLLLFLVCCTASGSEVGKKIKFISVDSICEIDLNKASELPPLVYSTMNVGYEYKQWVNFERILISNKVPFDQLKCYLIYTFQKLRKDEDMLYAIKTGVGDLNAFEDSLALLNEVKNNELYKKDFEKFIISKINFDLFFQKIEKDKTAEIAVESEE